MTAAAADHFASAVAALVGQQVLGVRRIVGGGNNELFEVTSAGGPFAIKRYATTPDDPRDRLSAEFAALEFLYTTGERETPRPIGVDRQAGLAAYEWIAGVPVESLDAADLDAAMAFLTRLHHASSHPGAMRLAAAADACVARDAWRQQVERRLAELEAVCGEPELASFLETRFRPLWRGLQPRLTADTGLSRGRQTLSPSDFGRHNMLRRGDGRLAFVDFEYFGWDDPVKLVADMMWHPGSAFDSAQRNEIARAACTVFGADPTFAERLDELAPVIAARWALIVLAEFVPERWTRRERAGAPARWSEVKQRQLRKAAAFVTAVQATRS